VPEELTETDVAVVGAGAAGLYSALVAAEQGARVLLISRSPLPQSASYWAQGGLAAALAPGDSPALHLEDTLKAGRGATRESAARTLCEEAPDRVRELQQRGIAFDTSPAGELLLSLEGGHGHRRVVHAGGSATGRHVTSALSERVAAHERVTVRARSSALRLWVEDGRCIGAITDFGPVRAAATVLSTGGAAALWRRTTNPPGATGTGLLLAHDAGAALADLEFLQFHPTALVSKGALDGFLVTEAVRGEGARLVTSEGKRFVDELAPRDEVARAVEAELESGKQVLLDMRSIPAERFPNIVEGLGRAGIDPTRELVPVAPAAHYMIGGVATDLDGRSSLPGLYAIGECACTGIHGANRLASNSLSECFVFGRRAALAAIHEPAPAAAAAVNPPSAEPTPGPDEGTREALWKYAGLVRDAAGLERLARESGPLAQLVARSALGREETRGCHVRADRPDLDPALDGAHLVVSEDGKLSPERWT
jgi:L-aspartate oxidase